MKGKGAKKKKKAKEKEKEKEGECQLALTGMWTWTEAQSGEMQSNAPRTYHEPFWRKGWRCDSRSSGYRSVCVCLSDWRDGMRLDWLDGVQQQGRAERDTKNPPARVCVYICVCVFIVYCSILQRGHEMKLREKRVEKNRCSGWNEDQDGLFD